MLLLKSRIYTGSTTRRKGHPNLEKHTLNNNKTARWHRPSARWETRWPHLVTARDGHWNWRPPRGDKESLTSRGSCFARCTLSVNGPLNVAYTATRYSRNWREQRKDQRFQPCRYPRVTFPCDLRPFPYFSPISGRSLVYGCYSSSFKTACCIWNGKVDRCSEPFNPTVMRTPDPFDDTCQHVPAFFALLTEYWRD